MTLTLDEIAQALAADYARNVLRELDPFGGWGLGRINEQLRRDEMAVKGTDPFFPVDERKNDRGATVQYANKGIALRTEISARVLAAIASDPAYDAGPEEAADTAVKWADALIARLNK